MVWGRRAQCHLSTQRASRGGRRAQQWDTSLARKTVNRNTKSMGMPPRNAAESSGVAATLFVLFPTLPHIRQTERSKRSGSTMGNRSEDAFSGLTKTFVLIAVENRAAYSGGGMMEMSLPNTPP